MTDQGTSGKNYSEKGSASMVLGEIISIDDRTVLVLGQELEFDKDQPDAGNAIMHRVGDTLFLVDTGVTTAFRDAVTRAIDRVGQDRKSVGAEEFVSGYTAGMNRLEVAGANANPMFTAMMALNQLQEIGLVADGAHSDRLWQRKDLVIPSVPDGRPHGLALVPAAAMMIGWKLRKLDR